MKKTKNKVEKEIKKEKIYRFSPKKVLHLKRFIVMISMYKIYKSRKYLENRKMSINSTKIGND